MFINLKEEGKFVHVKYDSDNIVDNLANGIYDVNDVYGNIFFTPNKAFEKGRVARAGIFDQVSTYMTKYFSETGRRVRKLMNQQTRLGMFFKGEPGTGKTFLAAKLALELIEKENGIGIYTTNLEAFDPTEVIDAIRTKDPNRLVIFIYDEFEKTYGRISNKSKDNLLAFLDGGRSRDNVVVFATANSLEGIPSTLLQRPGRFEKVLEFKITDDDVLTNLVTALIPDELASGVDINLIKSYALKTDNKLTIDKLKSIVRDALINFIDTGKLFPDDETEILNSINKDELIKESERVNKNKRKRPEPMGVLLRRMMENEAHTDRADVEEVEYEYDNN
jgi:SpoVK/Ycf46/Vps4 family AAA+-type ATPase